MGEKFKSGNMFQEIREVVEGSTKCYAWGAQSKTMRTKSSKMSVRRMKVHNGDDRREWLCYICFR
jgi:hypothetical protein